MFERVYEHTAGALLAPTKLGQMSDAVCSVCDRINSLLDDIKQFFAKIGESKIVTFFSTMCGNFGFPAFTTITAGLFAMALAYKLGFITRSVVNALAVGAAAFGIGKLWGAIEEALDSDEVNHNSGVAKQSGNDIVSLLVAIVLTCVPLPITCKTMISDIGRVIRPAALFAGSGLAVSAMIMDYLPQSLSTYIRKTFGLRNDLGLTTQELNSVAFLKTSFKLTSSETYQWENTELAQRILLTADTLKAGVRSSMGRDYVNSVLRDSQEMINSARATISLAGANPMPVGIYFYGVAGSGKSVLMRLLASRLWPSITPALSIFTRNGDNRYFDANINQPFCLYDEFGQGGDPAPAAKELISIINETVYYPVYADLVDKGKPFRPIVVGVCSNRSFTLTHGVDAEAFNRRFKFYEIEASPDFKADGKLDEAKVLAATDEQLTNVSYLVIRPSIWSAGRWQRCQPIPFAQLLARTKQEIASKADLARRLSAQYRGPQPTVAPIQDLVPLPADLVPAPPNDDVYVVRRVGRRNPPQRQDERGRNAPHGPKPNQPRKQPGGPSDGKDQRPGVDKQMFSWANWRVSDDEPSSPAREENTVVTSSNTDTRIPLLSPDREQDCSHEMWINSYQQRFETGEDPLALIVDYDYDFATFPVERSFLMFLARCADDESGFIVPPSELGVLTKTGKLMVPALATDSPVFFGYRVTRIEALYLRWCITAGTIIDQHNFFTRISGDTVVKMIKVIKASSPVGRSFMVPRLEQEDLVEIEPILEETSSVYSSKSKKILIALGVLTSACAVIGVGLKMACMLNKIPIPEVAPYDVPNQCRLCKVIHTGKCTIIQGDYPSQLERAPSEVSFGSYYSKGTVNSYNSALSSVENFLDNGVYRPQSDSSIFKQSSLYGSLRMNLVRLKFDDGCSIDGVVVKGNLLLTERHGFYRNTTRLAEGSAYSIHRMGLSTRGVFKAVDLFEVRTSGSVSSKTFEELVVYRLPISVCCRDITQCFATVDDIAKQPECHAVALSREEGFDYSVNKVSIVSTTLQPTFVYSPCFEESSPVPMNSPSAVLFYPERFKQGDCGTLLLDLKRGKILGMHAGLRACAGEALSFAVATLLPVIQDITGGVTTTQCLKPQIEFKDTEVLSTIPSYLLVGTGSKAKASSGGTNYVVSPYFDLQYTDPSGASVQTVTERPANLGSGEGDSARILKNFLAEASVKPKHFTSGQVSFGTEVIKEFFSQMKASGLTKLSWNETILGLPDQSLGPLVVNTSGGLPLVYLKTTSLAGKREWCVFNAAGQLVDVIERIKEEFIESEEVLKTGIVPGWVYQLSLKDELQSLKKFTEKRTRGVYVCPMVLGLLYRKYFGSLIARFHKSHGCSFSAVGMNVFSPDWDDMIRRLAEVGDGGFDGDFKGFQNLFTDQVMEIIKPVILSAFSDGDNAIRSTLLDAIIFHYVAVGEEIYQATGGNPSGNPLTTLLNTILCIMLIGIFYFMISNQVAPQYCTIQSFLRYTRLKGFGDDHIVSVSRVVSDWFHAVNVGAAAASLGIQYTAAHKGAALSEILTPIQDLLFLGNTSTTGLGILPGVQFYAVRQTSSCVKMLKYGSKRLSVAEDTQDRGNAFLRLISTNGREIFEGWRDALETIRCRERCPYPLITWYDVMRLWDRHCAHPEIFGIRQFGTQTRITALPPELMIELVIKQMEVKNAVTTDVSEHRLGVNPSCEPHISGFKNVKELCKEWILVENVAGPRLLRIPFCQLVIAAPSGAAWGGIVGYLATMYTSYSGSMRLLVQGEWHGKFSISFSPYYLSEERASTIAVGGSLGTNLGPRSHHCTNSFQQAVQHSFTTIHHTCRIPRNTDDISDPECNPGFFYVNILGSFNARILMMPGDDFRFQGLQFGVPLTVSTADDSFFLHGGTGVEVVVPEYFRHNMVASGITPYTQADLVRFYEDSDLSQEGSGFVVNSSALSDEDLRVFGYDVGPADTRVVDFGAIVDFPVDDQYQLTSIQWYLTPNVVAAPTAALILVPDGDVTLVDIGGVEYKSSESYTLPVSNLFVPEFTQAIGLTGKIGVPVLGDEEFFGKRGEAIETKTGSYSVVQTRDRLLVPVVPPPRFVVVKQMETPAVAVGGVELPPGPSVQIRGDSLAPVGCGEVPWTFATLAKRPTEIGTFPWRFSDAEGSFVFNIALPDELIEAVALSNTAVQTFQLVRGAIDIDITLQTNPMHVGAVAIVRSPLVDRSDIDQELNSQSMLYTPHEILHAGLTTSISMVVPFTCMYTSYPLVSYQSARSVCTLSCLVMSPLRSGPNGATSGAEITVYGRFREASFSILRPTDLQYSMQPSRRRFLRPPKPKRKIKRFVVYKQGGVMTKVDSRSYNITQAESSVLDIGATTDSYDQKGEVSLDKPNLDIQSIVPMVDRDVNLVGSVGFTNCHILDVGRFRQADPRHFQVGPADNSETDILSIVRMWGRLPSFVISPNLGSQTILSSFVCAPNPSMFTLAYGETFTPTPLERISQIFHKWRGSLEYKFVFSSSTQSFGVSFETSYLTNVTPEAKQSQYILFSRPKRREEVLVTVPFLSMYEMLRVTPGIPEPNLFNQTALGKLFVRLTTPLVGDTTAPDTIDVMVFVRAGPDFTLDEVYQGIADLSF